MDESKALPVDPGGGFLRRWSRRKDEARQGLPPLEPPPEPREEDSTQSTELPIVASAQAQTPQPPPLTLADAQALGAESDFAPFMVRGVAPGVRNAAMKKLFFTDPHYNLMDGLDIYIDDYSKAAPLPAAMLKSMASAKFLGLFDDIDQEEESITVAARAGAAGCGVPIHPAQPAGAVATVAVEGVAAIAHESPACVAPGRATALLNSHDEKNPDL